TLALARRRARLRSDARLIARLVLWGSGGVSADDSGGKFVRQLRDAVERQFLARLDVLRSPPYPDGDRAAPDHGGVAGIEVDTQRGVFVHSQHERAVGKLAFEPRQALLAQVAEAGVVGAAFGVVVV